MQLKTSLRYLEDRWDDKVARGLDQPELLRYRSNLLGSDLRITNFGGGNTSSKIQQVDPLSGKQEEVLWIKGSGGDLGSIKLSGLAALYSEKLQDWSTNIAALNSKTKWWTCIRCAPSARAPWRLRLTRLCMAFFPSRTSTICILTGGSRWRPRPTAARRWKSSIASFDHHLIWVPWQRPGFELAMMLRRAVQESPNCDGVVLGGHGLFTWGNTQQECYENTIPIIDQLGQFVVEHVEKKGGEAYSVARVTSLSKIGAILRSNFSFSARTSFGRAAPDRQLQRSSGSSAICEFGGGGAVSASGYELSRPLHPHQGPAVVCALATGRQRAGTARADRFRAEELPQGICGVLQVVRAAGFARDARCQSHRGFDSRHRHVQFWQEQDGSPAHRRVLHKRHPRDGGRDAPWTRARRPAELPQAGAAAPTSAFTVHANYVALPPSEAFRIEYWALEEAKIRRQPPEKELSRQVVLIVGGGSGIGREVALLAAERGAHVVVADRDHEAAKKVAEEAKAIAGKEGGTGGQPSTFAAAK